MIADRKNIWLMILCVFVVTASSVSCGTKNVEMQNEKDFSFRKCTISLALPKGWVAKAHEDFFNTIKYPNTKETYLSNISITDIPIDNLIADKTYSYIKVLISFEMPVQTGKDDFHEFPGVDDRSLQRYGDNYFYYKGLNKRSAIYLDKGIILPVRVFKLPEQGITPELEALFSHIRVKSIN